MTQPGDALQQVATEVAQLRDLFQRRLFEDRRRQELYDRLYKELEFARSDLVRQFVAPLYRELLLMLDRIASARSAGTDPALLLDSVVAEAEELLARRGVRPMATVGQAFDPRFHEAVDQVTVPADGPAGRIVDERRPGHLVDDWVLRAAQVIVGRHSAAGQTNRGDTAGADVEVMSIEAMDVNASDEAG